MDQPLYQLACFLLMTVLLATFWGGKPANTLWNLAGLLYIGFIAVNTIFIFYTESTWTYFFISLGISLLYVLAIGIIVQFLIKILKNTGSGESATIFPIIP